MSIDILILFIGYWFQPLIGCVLSLYLKGEMGKPTVGSGSMPMLHTGRYVNDSPWENLLCRLSPFLIPATSGHTDKHLSSALGGMMDVPVYSLAIKPLFPSRRPASERHCLRCLWHRLLLRRTGAPGVQTCRSSLSILSAPSRHAGECPLHLRQLW